MHTVLTTLVSVRHSEILKHRAWLRRAILGANRGVDDGGQGLDAGETWKCGSEQGYGGTKAWFVRAIYLVRKRIGSLAPHGMADLSGSSTTYPLSTQDVVAQCF